MPSAQTPEERILAALSRAEIPGVGGAGPRLATPRLAARLAALGIRVVLDDDPDYPPGLRDLPDRPRALYVRGTLPDRSRAVAIVGSRAATPYGLARAGELARDLVRLGRTVVSGLAQGIDAAAHRGAVEAGGASVAVLPGGLDAVTPTAHRALAESLCERGGLVSERAAGPPGFASAFVKRNRLIAALAGVTVVVEAAERSGALSTAAAARRLGRPVLAVPGDVNRPTARGTHGLLRQGARLCERAADIEAVLRAAGAAEPASADPGARLAAVLGAAPRTAEELARAAGVAVADVLGRLLALEWSGAARRVPGSRWIRGRS